ncbi:aldo/keto reductase [Ornithinimicrobium tianjinense]|uniref:NADP-dependent oxidoreductase n=1 Tax=Ornithinimicrobium tianjinense TaxID=1195761 RepID=A0A917BEF7_9MICO|nr:aldo/keto reductase [Ornithinimicrobium tianjinense]GGF40144.1 NADP-dependent oxidoreductase [Ornithinimicrobium tianjinense]
MSASPPLVVPPVALGTMTFGDLTEPAEAARIVDVALTAGVTWFDTANVYAGGRSEEILRDLLRGRDDVVVATKCGMPAADVEGEQALLSPSAVRTAVEGSLRRLGRDHVELLYLHRPDRATPIEETLSAVAELVREGKVGALGVSNYAAWQIGELVRAAEEVGAPRPLVSQQMYNMVARRLDEEYAEYAATTGLATIVYNPLAGGLLTGRYDVDTLPGSGRFATAANAATYRERYWDPRLFDAVRRLSAVAADAGMPLLEMALRWALGRPVCTSVLVGASRADQLEANLRAISRGPLGPDLMRAIDEVGQDLRGPMPAYNR